MRCFQPEFFAAVHPCACRSGSIVYAPAMAMDETNSLIEQRKANLSALRAKGIDPFKNKFVPTEKCAQARGNYVEGREVSVAGRVTAHRDMGKSMFIDVRDQSGRLQVYAQKNVLGDEQFDIFRHLDLGDFIGATGTLFTTKSGEISIRLTSFVPLAKALRPPPEKWHGLADTEIRYRQRYLDLVANPDVKEVFLKRSQIVREIRNFRNEGLSRKHNPEFTMLEAYQAYGDYESMMELVQSMICHVAQKVLGTMVIEHKDSEGKVTRTIDLTPPWRRIKYKDIVRERAGADWFDVSPQQRRERAIKLGAEIAKEYEDFE